MEASSTQRFQSRRRREKEILGSVEDELEGAHRVYHKHGDALIAQEKARLDRKELTEEEFRLRKQFIAQYIDGKLFILRRNMDSMVRAVQ